MSKLVSPTHVRRYALEVIAAKRPALAGKITRVSGGFIERIEARTRAAIQSEVDMMPSTGATLK